MMKKWRNILVVSIFLLTGLSMWMSGKARERNENSEIRCYGGDAPDEIRLVLEQLNEKMTTSKEIIAAQSNRFAFVDQEGNIHHYSYAYGTLWNDDCPAVANLENFYFEYRNRMGSRFTGIQGKTGTITRVGYSMRLISGDREIFVCSTVHLSSKTTVQELHDTMLLVYQ
jgi:hypothetical protein